VDTDRPIKVLFERQGQSLLPFIGESGSGVRVAAVESVELPVPTRRVDSVLRLEREGLVWYRHLEFQSGPDPDMPRRCFEYNSRLILHYDAAVFTTVLYLFPGSDSGAEDAFRLFVGDRLAYEWRFDVVRLWEIDVGKAFESGLAAPLALVPLLRGGEEPEKLLAAVRMLDALPRPESADAMATLLDLASQRYDRATFSNVLGKDRVMQSWLWQLGRDEGEARGEVRALRLVCADLAKEFHPRVAGRILAAIDSCDRPETLRAWILQCPKLTGGEFAALVTGQPPGPVTRSRTSRPSRRSRRLSGARRA
jgi:hypothetical protein